jgi:hypothetical protein
LGQVGPFRLKQVEDLIRQGKNLAAASQINGSVPGHSDRPGQNVVTVAELAAVFEGGKDDLLENIVGGVDVSDNGGSDGRNA